MIRGLVRYPLRFQTALQFPCFDNAIALIYRWQSGRFGAGFALRVRRSSSTIQSADSCISQLPSFWRAAIASCRIPSRSGSRRFNDPHRRRQSIINRCRKIKSLIIGALRKYGHHNCSESARKQSAERGVKCGRGGGGQAGLKPPHKIIVACQILNRLIDQIAANYRPPLAETLAAKETKKK